MAKLLDPDDFREHFRKADYLSHMESLAKTDDHKEKYRRWTTANADQLKRLYCNAVMLEEEDAFNNCIVGWTQFRYAVWHLNFHSKNAVDSEIEEMLK